MSETYECDNCGEDVPATVGGEGLHKCSECVPISELEDLIDQWEQEIEEYIDAPVEVERTMSAQQYHDKCELQQLIDDHKE